MVKREKGPYHTSAIALELANMEGPDRAPHDETEFRQKYRVRHYWGDRAHAIVGPTALCVQGCVCRAACAGLCVQG